MQKRGGNIQNISQSDHFEFGNSVGRRDAVRGPDSPGYVVLGRRLPADEELGLPGCRHRTQAGTRAAWRSVWVRGWRRRRFALGVALQRFRLRYESRF